LRLPFFNLFDSLYRENAYVFDFIQLITGRHYYNPTADLCIDGFPRSANSFAVNLVQTARPDLRINHHLHSPVIIKKAVRDEMPIFILFRNPEDAVTSEYIRLKFSEERIPDVKWLINRYIRYYNIVQVHVEDVFTVSFEKVTQTPVEYLKYVFSKLGFDNEGDYLEVVNETKIIGRAKITENIIYTTSIPTRERDEYKNHVKRNIMSKYDFSQAIKIYQTIAEKLPQ
jgi:hypothetical protein